MAKATTSKTEAKTTDADLKAKADADAKAVAEKQAEADAKAKADAEAAQADRPQWVTVSYVRQGGKRIKPGKPIEPSDEDLPGLLAAGSIAPA